MKHLPMRSKLFHAIRQTDRLKNSVQLTVDISNLFQKKPNKRHSEDRPLLCKLFSTKVGQFRTKLTYLLAPSGTTTKYYILPTEDGGLDVIRSMWKNSGLLNKKEFQNLSMK